MDLILESRIAWIVFGTFLTFAALIVYSNKRTNQSLLLIGGAIFFTLMGLMLEHFYETPREQITLSLEQLAAEIEANNEAAVLAHIAPGASKKVRQGIETLKRYKVIKARVLGDIQVSHGTTQPVTRGSAIFNGLLQATQKKSAHKGLFASKFQLDFRQVKGRWLLVDVTLKKSDNKMLRKLSQ